MKNPLLLTLITLILIVEKSDAQSKIFGVVTFENEYHDVRSDIGTRIYLVDSTSVGHELIFTSMDSIDYISGWQKLKKDHERQHMRLKSESNILNKLHSYGIYKDEDFEKMDKRSFLQRISMTEDKNLKTTVDGNGSYSISVKPSTYYILIVSNNKRGYGMTNVSGLPFHKKIKVKENEEINASWQF